MGKQLASGLDTASSTPGAFISWIIPTLPAEPKSCLALGVWEQRGGSQEPGESQWNVGMEPGRGRCVLELHPHPAGPQTPTLLLWTSQGSCSHPSEQGLTGLGCSCHPPRGTARTGCLLFHITAMEIMGMRSPRAGDDIQHSTKSRSSSPPHRGSVKGCHWCHQCPAAQQLLCAPLLWLWGHRDRAKWRGWITGD